jgi:diaminopimelate decarboxylase
MLSDVAVAMGKRARCALRVNPDVDARTHAKITTGLTENKFGVPIALAPALYARMCGMPGLDPVGIAVHIGSQITEGVGSYRAAYARLGELVRGLRAQGLPVLRVDCGGGPGHPLSR